MRSSPNRGRTTTSWLPAGPKRRQRRLFEDGPPLDITLTSEFNLINKERNPDNSKQFPGVLTIDGRDIAVTLGSRGHFRLKRTTCDFVPIKVVFAPAQMAGTVFEGQTTLKLGTHCQNAREFDQYVMREYLAYRLANLVTPATFRARLVRATLRRVEIEEAESRRTAPCFWSTRTTWRAG